MCPCRRSSGGERAELAVLDAEAGDFAGGFALELIHFGGAVQKFAAGREGDPVNGGDGRGDAGGDEFAGGGIPVVGENAVGRAGGDEDALGARGAREAGGETR